MSQERRWKIWYLSPTQLVGFLNDLNRGRVASARIDGFPADGFVHSTHWDTARQCFGIIVQSSFYTTVPEGAEVPTVPIEIELRAYSPNMPVPVAGTLTLPGPLALSGRISRRCFEELRAGCTPKGSPSPLDEEKEAEEDPRAEKKSQAKKKTQVARK